MAPPDLGSRSEAALRPPRPGVLGAFASGPRARRPALARGVHHPSCPATADGPCFGRPRPWARGASLRVPPPPRGEVGERRWRDAQAGVPSAGWPRAQLAFKDSMVRGILQFTPGIAFRYVLHRCESLDIRCRESSGFERLRRVGPPARGGPALRSRASCSLAPSAPGFVGRAPAAPRGGGAGGRRRVGTSPRRRRFR